MRPVHLPALREVLLHRKAEQAQRHYAVHLLWLLGAQLFALGGGRDYPVPDVYALFPDEAAPRDRRSAQDVRQSILRRLTLTDPPTIYRKENRHG